MQFSAILIDWYRKQHRRLPWRETQDAYKIWLSEIILQQTRVDQGLPYYLKFVETYPTIEELANAPIDDILKLWQGLGYYSRTRNLHKAAQQVLSEHSGNFPSDYKELLKLSGIGPYTAAAIASFAFHLPYAVVDGNVYRVLSRYFGVELPIDRPLGQKYFAELATEVLDDDRPHLHNQAIMEFGAVQCTPKNPDCAQCPLNESCMAVELNSVSDLPRKEGKTKVKEIWMNYLFIEMGDKVAIRKRDDRGIWRGLYDFPVLESERSTSRREAQNHPDWKKILNNGAVEVHSVTDGIKHRLSHRLLNIRFWHLITDTMPQFPGIVMVDREELPTFAVPIVIHQWMEDRGLA